MFVDEFIVVLYRYCYIFLSFLFLPPFDSIFFILFI